jgi:hypothetical protein
MEMVQGGERRLQGCREAQGWTWSNQFLSMGMISTSAPKVFDKMPERK